MEYRIIAVQTIFGEERERRLKLAFDIIWNLDIKKARAGRKSSSSQISGSPTVAMQTDEIEPDSGERHNNNGQNA